MKFVLTTFLIFGFLGAAVFGIFAVACPGWGCGHDAHNWCLASQAQAAPCPEKSNAPVFINFHLNALKIFSQAVFADNLFYILALAALAIAMAAEIIRNHVLSRPAFIPNLGPGHFRELLSFPLELKLSRWLARHENSPAII